MSNGADALIHYRIVLEELLQTTDEELAIIDIDLKNAFPSSEWSAIRAVVATWIIGMDELVPCNSSIGISSIGRSAPRGP